MLGADEPPLHPLASDLRAWADAIMRDIEPAQLRAQIETFPAPRNRLHALEAMAKADELLLEGFANAGWQTEIQPYEVEKTEGYLDYEQDGKRAGTVRTTYEHLKGANTIAIKEGESSNDIFIIGAHLDTIRDSPGADDNTASVIALLELARLLAPFRFRDTIVLAAFDMEEINFSGSKTFVREFASKRNVKGVIIFETMAYTTTEPKTQFVPTGSGLLFRQQMAKLRRRNFVGDWTLALYRKDATSIAQSFAEALTYIAGPHSTILLRDPINLSMIGRFLKYLVPMVKNFARSDHASFWEAGIPAIMISDTANFRNPNYHRPTDTPETLDYERLAAIIGATATAIAQLTGIRGLNSEVMFSKMG